MADFSPDDFNAAVQAVAGEAANQPPEGQAAVASTILNRASLLGKPIAAIATDPETYNGVTSDNAKMAVPGSPLYKTIASNIAPVFKNGPTTKATHFYSGDAKPPWDNGTGVKIGDQVFLDRSDLLASSKPAPTEGGAPSPADLEAHFNGQAPAEQVVGVSPKGAVVATVGGGGGEDNGAGGPSPADLAAHFGDANPGQAPLTPAQQAAAKDASTFGNLTTNILHTMFHGPFGAGEVNTEVPFLSGLSQNFLDELAGKGFGAITGIRNAFGANLPYGMSDAEAMATAKARQGIADIKAQHPLISTGAELAGTVLPAFAGGEALGAGASAPEAATALGRLGQFVLRPTSGALKGAALGGVTGGVSTLGAAQGDLADRAPAALSGALTGALLGAPAGAASAFGVPGLTTVGGAALGATAAPPGKRAQGAELGALAGFGFGRGLPYLGEEAGALAGAVKQGVVSALTGRGETTAADYFASKSPSVRAFQNATVKPDVAETVEPTEAETQAATQKLKQMMAVGGKTVEDLQKVPEDLPYTTAEALGSQTTNHAASLARRAGTTPDAAVSVIGQRQEAFARSILDDFGKATGIAPEEAGGNIDALIARQKAEADPLFTAVRAHPGPVWNADLAAISQRPVVKKAIDAAANDLLNGGKNPTAMGFKLNPDTGLYELNPDLSKTTEQQPTAETWDLVRQRIGDQVERNQFTGRIIPDSVSRGNYNVNVAQRDLTNILAGDGSAKNPGLIPGYRDALNKASDYKTVQSAFQRGKDAVLSDKVTAADFAKTFAGLSDGEKEAWRAGVANKLYEQSQTQTGLRQALLKSPNFRAKMQIIMGDQADTFINRLTQRIRLQNSGQRILPSGQSQTAPLALATVESSPADVAGNVAADVAHAVKSPGSFIVKKVTRHALGDTAANVTETPGYRNAYGRLLLQHPSQTAEELSTPQAAAITVRQLPPVRPRASALAGYAVGRHQ